MEKNKLILLGFVFGIFLLSFVYAAPQIEFVDPTPDNNSVVTDNWIYINATILDGNISFVDFNNSLVGWWRMNNESGENESFVRDWSSYGNHGNVTGATYNSTGGIYGGGFEFNGVDDYVDIADSDSLSYNGIQNKTISFWFKANEVSGTQTILSKWENSPLDSLEYIVYLSSSTLNSQILGANPEVTETGINADQWYHVVFIMNSTKGNILYVNGTLSGSTVDPGSVISTISTLKLGQNQNTNWFNGSIEEIIVWNRILTQTEIEQLYNNSQNKFENNFTELDNGVYNFTLYSQNSSGGVSFNSVVNVEVWAKPKVIFNSPLDEQTNLFRNVTLNVTIIDYEGELINITFLNSTNGIICQENNVASGSVVGCNYNNLDKETKYKWSVNVTDGLTTNFISKNFTVGVAYSLTENYDNKRMSFIWTCDDWDGDSVRHSSFMNKSDKAQELNIWYSSGFITNGSYDSSPNPPLWLEILPNFQEGYLSAASHSRHHYHSENFTLENATLEANGSKNDIEENLTLPIYNWFNSSQHLVAWIAPYYEVSDNLTLALNMSNYLVHRGDNFLNGGFGWAGFNESNGIYWDTYDYSFSWISSLNYTPEDFIEGFDSAYILGNQFHLMGHPWPMENVSDGSIASQTLEYISNRSDVWYVGLDHAYMYRYITNRTESKATINITSNPEDNNITLVVNISSEERNKYGLSYPITYKISIPNNWTDVYVYYKNLSTDNYTLMENKTRETVWNGIEAYRTDLNNDVVYISKAFPQQNSEVYLLLSPVNLSSVSVPSVVERVATNNPGGSSGTKKVTIPDADLEKGSELKVNKGDYIEFEFKGGTKKLKIEEVSESEVHFVIDDKNYYVSENSAEEIDLDGDGIKDLRISVNGIVNGIADIKIENVKNESLEGNGNIIDKIKSKWYVYVIIGVVIVLIVVGIVLKKRRK